MRRRAPPGGWQEARAKAWETRRKRYGDRGHGADAYRRRSPEVEQARREIEAARLHLAAIVAEIDMPRVMRALEHLDVAEAVLARGAGDDACDAPSKAPGCGEMGQ